VTTLHPGYATTEWLMARDEPDPWAYLEQITRRPPWQAQAACRGSGPATFFPGRGGDSRAAVAVCDACAVVRECRDFAVGDPDIVGTWGGTSGRQRRQIRTLDQDRSVVNGVRLA